MEGPPNFFSYDEFDAFSYGSLFMDQRSQYDQIDAVLDSVRYFAEECDSMQGFQALVDVDSGFGGLAKSILQEVKDEYAKKPIFALGAPSANTERSKFSNLNESLGLVSLAQFCDIFVPLKNIIGSSHQLKIDNAHRMAATFASAFDTITLPTRLRKQFVDLRDLCQTLTVMPSMKIVALSAALPLSNLAPDTALSQYFDDLGPLHAPRQNSFLTDLSPLANLNEESPVRPFVHSFSIRGISSLSLHDKKNARNQQSIENRHNKKLFYADDLEEMISHFVAQTPAFKSLETIAAQPLPIHASFPSIFSDMKLDSKGFEAGILPVSIEKLRELMKQSQAGEPIIVEAEDPDPLSIPMASYAQSSKRLFPFVKNLADTFSNRADFKKFGELFEISKDDREQMNEDLQSLSDNYAGDDGEDFSLEDDDEEADF